MKRALTIILMIMVLVMIPVFSLAASCKTPQFDSQSSTETSITVSWTSVKGALGYQVRWAEYGCRWKKTVTTKSTSMGCYNLDEGTTYVFQVRACYKKGLKMKTTAWSDIYFVTTEEYDDYEDLDEEEEETPDYDPEEDSRWGEWTDWRKTRETFLFNTQEQVRYHCWAAKCRNCGNHNPYWGYNVKCLNCGTYLSKDKVEHVNIYLDYMPSIINLMGRNDGVQYNGLNYWFCEERYRYRYWSCVR